MSGGPLKPVSGSICAVRSSRVCWPGCFSGWATRCWGSDIQLLLALWGAIVRLIPWFGALIAVLPALFIGIGISSTVGILATIYTIGILLTLKLVIEPRFFSRHKYSSLLIVLFVIALAETFGFIGVVLAPPLAVAIQILFQHLYSFAVPTDIVHRNVGAGDWHKKTPFRIEKAFTKFPGSGKHAFDRPAPASGKSDG